MTDRKKKSDVPTLNSSTIIIIYTYIDLFIYPGMVHSRRTAANAITILSIVIIIKLPCNRPNTIWGRLRTRRVQIFRANYLFVAACPSQRVITRREVSERRRLQVQVVVVGRRKRRKRVDRMETRISGTRNAGDNVNRTTW